MYEKMRKYQSFKQQQFNAKQIARSYSSSQQNYKPILSNNLYSSINTHHLNSNINNKTGQFNKQKSAIFNGTLPFPGRFSSSSLINPQKQHILQKQKQSQNFNINYISRKSKSKQNKSKQIPVQSSLLNNKPKKTDKSFQKNKSILKEDEQKILKQNISKLKKYYTTAVDIDIQIDQNKQNNPILINNIPSSKKQRQSHKKLYYEDYKKKYQNEIKQNIQKIDKLNQQINQLKSIISLSKNQIKVIKNDSTKMEECFKLTILKVLKIFTICEKVGQKNIKNKKNIELNNQIVKVISKEIVELFKNNNIHLFIQKFNIKNELNLYSNNQNQSIQSQITFTQQQRLQCRQQFIQLFSGKNLLDTFNNNPSNNTNLNLILAKQPQISNKPLKSIYSQFNIQLQQQQHQHSFLQETHPLNIFHQQKQKQFHSSNICRKLFTQQGNEYDIHNSSVNQFITEFNNHHNQEKQRKQQQEQRQNNIMDIITPRLSEYCFKHVQYVKDNRIYRQMKNKIDEEKNLEEDSLAQYINTNKQSDLKQLSKSKSKQKQNHKHTSKSHKKHHNHTNQNNFNPNPTPNQCIASYTYTCITSYPPKQSNNLKKQKKQNYLILHTNDKIKLIRKIKTNLWIAQSENQTIGFVEEMYLGKEYKQNQIKNQKNN